MSTTGYGAGADMGTLLRSMKEKLAQTPGHLDYAMEARIKIGPWWWAPWDRHMIYLEPIGSPEEELGEQTTTSTSTGGNQTGTLKRARHIVRIECVVPYMLADNEDIVVGLSNEMVGLTEMVGDALDFFENNVLGLEGLDPGRPPICQADDNSYGELQVDDEEMFFVRMASITYEAWTRPFFREAK